LETQPQRDSVDGTAARSVPRVEIARQENRAAMARENIGHGFKLLP